MDFSRSRARHLRMIGETQYPVEIFSPINTSTPKNKKKTSILESLPLDLSSDSDSSGNLTAKAIIGVETSIVYDDEISLASSNASDVALTTAIEYINPTIFQKAPKLEKVSREEIYEGFFKIASKKLDNCTMLEIGAYAEIATERILWDACKTWSGEISTTNKEEFLENLIVFNDSPDYLQYTIHYVFNLLCDISGVVEKFELTRENVYIFFIFNGIPEAILDRIFYGKIVRNTTNDSFSIRDVTHLIFALEGLDDPQSIEYWFRVLDVDNDGVLSPAKLKPFYMANMVFLELKGIDGIPFNNIIEQYSDMLNGQSWTRSTLKRSKAFAPRLLVGFISAIKVFEYETDERMNANRLDDEEFGMQRTMWKRFLDHLYNPLYRKDDESSDSTF